MNHGGQKARGRKEETGQWPACLPASSESCGLGHTEVTNVEWGVVTVWLLLEGGPFCDIHLVDRLAASQPLGTS
jgi:hypothetical protein